MKVEVLFAEPPKISRQTMQIVASRLADRGFILRKYAVKGNSLYLWLEPAYGYFIQIPAVVMWAVGGALAGFLLPKIVGIFTRKEEEVEVEPLVTGGDLFKYSLIFAGSVLLAIAVDKAIRGVERFEVR